MGDALRRLGVSALATGQVRPLFLHMPLLDPSSLPLSLLLSHHPFPFSPFLRRPLRSDKHTLTRCPTIASPLAFALPHAQVDGVQLFMPSHIDADFALRNRHILQHRRGAGFWLWKPFLLNRTLHGMEEGDLLMYVDAQVCVASTR
eukprot:3695546-Rhodomonas_salina.1